MKPSEMFLQLAGDYQQIACHEDAAGHTRSGDFLFFGAEMMIKYAAFFRSLKL